MKNNEGLTDTKIVLSILGQTYKEAIKNFIEFHNKSNEDITGNEEFEYEMMDKLTDEQAKIRIEAVLGIENVMEIKGFNTDIRNKNLRKLQEIKGITRAQIARVTSINKGIIERAMKEK